MPVDSRDRDLSPARAPRPLTEDQFQDAIEALIEDAEAYADANWKKPREDGWARYKGHVDAKPEPGGDDTVHAEVRDAVMQLLPEIMEQLAGSEEPIEYYTHDPRKVASTRQATQMGLGIWWEGGGWQAIYDAVMHAAVARIGALKVYRHEKLCMEESEFEGTPEEVDQYGQIPGYVLLDRQDQEAQIEDPMTGELISYVARSSAQIRRYYVDAKLTIDAPFPGEIICTSTADPDTALCIGQKSTVRMADLRSMGMEPEELEDVQGWDDTVDDERAAQTDEQKQARKDYGSWALKPITLYEVYVLLDANGDGLLERWKVIAAGDDKKVLRAEQRASHDDQPYVLFPFRRSPQTIQGLSVSDLTWDLMESKTKLHRDLMNNTSDVGSPMILASGTVNWAALQTWRRNKVIDERVPGSVRWFAPPPIASEVLPVLQYLDGLTEQRIGTMSQGLAPDQLTSVAAVAIAGAQGKAARAIKLTVRTIAEMGLRPAFQKLLRLMVGEAPRAVVGEDGKYQVVDPRQLDPAFGVRARVGLGAMALEERKTAYRELMGITAQLIPAPPPYGQIADPVKVAAMLQAFAQEFRGLGAGRFFSGPEEMQQKLAQQGEPPPDPKMIEAQGKLKQGEQKMQVDAQLQSAKSQGDMQAKAIKAQLDYQAKLEAIRAKTMTDQQELAIESQLEKYAIDKQARSGQGKINRSG